MSNIENVNEAIARSFAGENGSDNPPDSDSPAGNGRKRKRRNNVSPEGRARMREGARIRQEKARAAKEAEAAGAPPPITDQDVAACALLGSTVWTLMGKIIGMRPLFPEESHELGAAMAPVVVKWMPFMSKWAPELNLVVVTVTLYQATRIVKAEPEAQPEPEPEPAGA